MRTQSICRTLAIVLICSLYGPGVYAQWVNIGSVGAQEISHFLATRQGVYAIRDTDLYRSTDNGDSWQKIVSWSRWPGEFPPELLPMGTDSVLIIIAQSYTKYSYLPFHIVRSIDGGQSWEDTTLVGGEAPRQEGICAINKRIFFCSNEPFSISSVHISTDNGASWGSTKSEGLPKGWSSFLIAKGSLLFLGHGNDAQGQSLFRSADYGESWVPIGPAAVYEDLVVVGNTLVAWMQDWGGFNDRTVISTDDGETWSERPMYLGHRWTHDGLLFCAPLFARTGLLGPMVSLDIGTTWKSWIEGLPRDFNSDPEIWVESMAFSDSFAFAQTSLGLWRRPLSELVTSANVNSANLPISFRLNQNYPNPFNPSTTIKYELPKSSMVRLNVYDLLGREISVLVNERKDAGVHEVKFDGSNLASGVYFYRLQAGTYVETRKLLLLR